MTGFAAGYACQRSCGSSARQGSSAQLPVTYGVQEIAVDGAGSGHIAPLIGGAAVGVAFFCARRGPLPMVELRLFRSRGFTGAARAGRACPAGPGGLELAGTDALCPAGHLTRAR